MIVKGILALSLGLAASAFFAVPQKAATTTSQGVYTARQAAQGHTIYTAKCAPCHQADLKGKDEDPPLVGKSFTSDWVGRPLNDLFDKIKNTMPADNPGTLTGDQTAKLLAYILSSNQFPAGKTALSADDQALTKVQFVPPPTHAARKASHNK